MRQKKQEDNKEETTGTATAIKQAARVKRQRHHKQEPADEAQKQAKAKERIRKQQQSIEGNVTTHILCPSHVCMHLYVLPC